MTSPLGVPGASRSPVSQRAQTASTGGLKPGELLGYATAQRQPVLGAGDPPRAAARPTPVAQKPKGRFFMGTIVLAIVGLCAFKVWNAFLRYEAYGVVSGREIEVAPPWTGAVEAVYVNEGAAVEQGALLCSLTNLVLAQDRARLQDELRVAQADLGVELTRAKLDEALRADRLHEARAEYFAAWGELLEEEARGELLAQRYERQLHLYQSGVISSEAFEEAREAAGGQADKVGQLRRSVEALQARAELDGEGSPRERLLPFELRLRLLQADLGRVDERLRQGEVRAPARGTIVRRACFVGEQASEDDALFTLLEEGSEVVRLFIPQAEAERVRVGQELELQLEPNAELVRARVQTIEDALVPPPPSVARFALVGESFLPVRPLPLAEGEHRPVLRLGAVAKLTRFP